MNKISNCEVCGETELYPVINLGEHPMCDDLVPIDSDLTCSQYPIEIVYCKSCFTAHQLFQVPKVKLFPSNYHYRSRFTKDVLQGMKDLVKSCSDNIGEISGKRVLDIGCNDGSLLDFFKEQNAITAGIEPTDAFKEAREKNHLILGKYFNKESALQILKEFGVPDIITFTNVFAHIENLSDLLETLKLLIGPNTTLVIENHYLGAVLKKSQFDTFYHEHPRTYSLNSFLHIAKNLDLKLQLFDFPSRYGGNIRVFISKKESSKTHIINEILAVEKKFFDELIKMNKDITKWISLTKEEINNRYKKYGKLSCKAFPGRAAILVKLLDLDENMISAVYEKPGSLKIGNYLPGTRIPIYSDNDFFNLDSAPKTIINLAWHIEKEITNYMRNNGYDGEIYNILDSNTFS